MLQNVLRYSLLILLLVATSCSNSSTTGPVTPATSQGVLVINVLDSATGAKIPNVSVLLSPTGRLAATDLNGYLLLDSVPAGKYLVTFTKSGYRTQTDSITVLGAALVSSTAILVADHVAITQSIVGWNPLQFGTANLYSVCYADAKTLFAVGVHGLVVRSTDSGATWFSMPAPTTNDLYTVHFSDARTGVVLGNAGSIFLTSDGGMNWTDRSTGLLNFRASNFTSATLGWAVGGFDGTSPGIYMTTNGGLDWTQQSTAQLASESLYGVAFPSASEGFVAGLGSTLYRTASAGANWIQEAPSIGADWKGVAFSDVQHGWVVGSGGRTLNTSDGGVTWKTGNTLATTLDLSAVATPDANTVIILGGNGNIFHSTDGGATFTPVGLGGVQKLRSVAFVDQVHGCAVGDGGWIVLSIVR